MSKGDNLNLSYGAGPLPSTAMSCEMAAKTPSLGCWPMPSVCRLPIASVRFVERW